mmetsp:Transcript_51875/g.155687  ORF Transcript_51875/g.155687 Transcript_51875/m.155687 type:complete len:269 (-) Transcript_51875:37-843(-)
MHRRRAAQAQLEQNASRLCESTSKRGGGDDPISRRELFAWSALIIHSLLVIYLLLGPGASPPVTSRPAFFKGQAGTRNVVHGHNKQWHGGHPADDKTGSCWCGHDSYCMCNPSLAVDVVLTSGADYVWLVRRKDTGQLATVGGFVDVGETTLGALRRELKEETGLDVPAGELPRLLGLYDDPRRDNRRHIASAVFALEIPESSVARAADDVKDVVKIKLDEIGTKYSGNDLYADHFTILLDYKEQLRGSASERHGEVVANPVRVKCVK